ncbi:hypothetical protein RDI58_021195 [Solanum bulbocastanum]|uniref:Hexosyltransferase n=1 Tax=Solanum bulbocastanum TaxID=147425 RepID=A0AAN8TEZ3_SOLBU
MNSRGSTNRLSSTSNFRSRMSFLMLSMFSTMAALYVAGRVYLIQELDRRTGQGRSAISVDDTLKIITCREQQKRLTALQMELGKASQEGFVSKHLLDNNERDSKKKLLAVIGVSTNFGNKKNRDAIRKAWMPTGLAFLSSPLFLDFFCNIIDLVLIRSPARKKLEEEKGIVIRFVIGRSSNRGDSSDRAIDDESRNSDDFIILNDHVESPQEQSKKTKSFFAHAVEHWDAEFYAKVNDNVYVNLGTQYKEPPICMKEIAKELPNVCQHWHVEAGNDNEVKNRKKLYLDAIGAVLTSYLDKPRAYIGCMKSGEVFSQPEQKWYEPEWWKFGDGKSYFRHASGEIFAISKALAQFISINRSILRSYAHDDVSAGSWFIGLDVKYADEGKFCCSSWSSGSVCAAA